MERVLRWLRMLGTTGAVVNARAMSEQRQQEQWIVDSLLTRLALTDRKAETPAA